MNFESVETYFKTGIEFQEAGKWGSAIASYQQALQIAPHQAEIYQKLAEAFVLNGQLEAGIKAIQTAVNLKPNFAVAYLSIGNVLQQQNQIELAIWAYTEALDVKPEFTEAQANLGSMYYHLQRFSEAIQCYQKAIYFDSNSAIIYWMLGNAFSQTDQLEKAISCYQKAIDLQPNQVKFYLKLAAILDIQGKTIQAISYYQTILRLQPDCSEAIVALRQLTQVDDPNNWANNLTGLSFVSNSREEFEEGGVDLASPLTEAIETEQHYPINHSQTDDIFVENAENITPLETKYNELKAYQSQAKFCVDQGQFEQAITICQQALKIQPKFYHAYVILGNALHFQGKLEAAIRAYSQVLKLQPNFAEIYGNRGTMYAKLNQIDKAIADYQQALELQPNFAVVHWNLGKIFQRLGRFEESIKSWKTALEIQPNLNGAKLHIELGNLLTGQKQFKAAISSYQKALEIQPSEVEAHLNLGCLYSEQKQYETAIKTFQAGIQINPKNLDLYLNMGFALVKLNHHQEAINCYQNLLNIQPDNKEAYASLGNIYANAGQVKQAIENYEQAIKIKPDWAEIYCRLAHIQKQDQPQVAIANLEKSIELNPNYIEAHQQLCDLLSHSTNLTKARKAADQYCQQCGEKVPVLSAIAYIFAYTQSGAYQQAVTKLVELEKICNERIKTFSQFEVNLLYEILIFIISHVRDALVENANFYQRIAAEYYERRVLKPLKVVKNSPSLSTKSSPNALKIGFISKHFRRHSVGWCSEALIRELSTITPNIHLYVTGRLQADEVTQKFEEIAQKFYWPKSYPNGFASAEELAQEILHDQVDILIDLDSVTVPANVQILNYSPAPVCLTWLGFDAPYITNKHYFLCDWNTHPSGREQYYCEQLIRLPETSVAISGLASYQVNRNLIRKQLKIDQDKLVYLCVAPGRKTNFEMIEAQVKILKAVPDSLMIRKGQGDHLLIREMYHQSCEEQGVDFNRILFIGLTKTEEEHRAIYQVVDVLLDSYPYNGGTHNLEALWSNLPILTRAGEQYLSRMGYAFLQAVNLDVGVAWSWEEYTELGIKLGTDAALRTQIREHLINSKKPENLAPLWNPQKLAKQMYQVFKKLRSEHL
ncbi:tetratricopeptide repeat protein [Lyngbya sp. PCC 8106]|uniref:tetratricopeptide repeat protein n=1 Tax=Lyngbya sp. (strain PCC 8106) TaxID=313612 RepID=UPI0000EA97F8|nr:tetratricopeptide repeat protein [Lyngbya sp. PCC 8106]EAW36890.1 TPR repeat protein [Lyngbya sp. PCC 8106]